MKTYIQTVKNELQDQINKTNQTSKKSNLTPGEKEAMARLRNREDIIISKADKGSEVVIQDVHAYVTEAKRQLKVTEFYKPVDLDLTPVHTKTINNTIEQFARGRLIPERTAKALKVSNPKTAKICTLPRIHKPGKLGRPISSTIGNAT